MTKNPPLHLRATPATQKRVTRLVNLAQAYAFKGSMRPDDAADIEDALIDEKDRFLSFLANLEHRARSNR